MQQHDNHIPRDEEIRRILGEDTPGSRDWDQPGERVWQGIEESLDARRRRGAAWWIRTSGVLLIFLGLSAGWWLFQTTEMEPGHPAATSAARHTHPANQKTSPPSGATEPAELSSPVETKAAPRNPSAPEGSEPAKRPSAGAGPASRASDSGRANRSAPVLPADSPLRAALPGEALPPDPAGINLPEHIDNRPGTLAQEQTGESALAALPLRPIRLEGGPILLPEITPALPIASPVVATRVRHEFGLYGHGNGVSTTLQARQAGFRPPGVLSEEQTAYRMGLQYQLVTSQGWFLGTGLDYQRIREARSLEHEIPFTRQGGLPEPQGLAQTFTLAMYGSMGQIRATVPVRVLERMAPLDYQEGETIRLNVDWSQQLDLLRIPLWAGWRQEWQGWFVEGRGGLALSMPLSYRGEIRQVREIRNRVRIREGSSTAKPDGLRDVIPEWQAGLRAGIQLPQGWQVHAGWEYWRSWDSVIRHPEYRATLQGQGVTLGISKTL